MGPRAKRVVLWRRFYKVSTSVYVRMASYVFFLVSLSSKESAQILPVIVKSAPIRLQEKDLTALVR